MRVRPAVLLVLLTFSFALPQRAAADGQLDLAEAFALAEDSQELARTWDQGFVAIPAPAFGPDGKALFGMFGQADTQQRLAALAPGVSLPVVLYLHGCTGIGVTAAQLPLVAEQAGFAMIAPNSFGRAVRPKNCDSTTHSSGMFPPALLYRRAELIAAFDRLRQLDWVDPARIVLAGFSEGGIAVALWGGAVEVAGYAVLGWTCTAPPDWGWLVGLRTPTDRPALAMVSRDDPWYDWPGWRGDCLSADHGDVQSLVLERPGHVVLYYPEAQDALLKFLRRWAE